MIRFSSFHRFFLQAALIIGAVVGIGSGNGAAEQRELAQPRAGVDAVLVIDASGSMLKTDAQMLRYEGAKLFLNFLSESDRLAIVSFSDKAHVITDLREFRKEASAETVRQIEGIKPEGQYSDMLEGIRAAGKILDSSPRNDAERIIVLLSDGKMEPNPSVGIASVRTVELVSQALPDLKAREIKVHSLAFSLQADKALLGEISAATDGLNWYTATSEDIHRSFASLFLAVKRPQVVPMRSRSFVLDEDVDEATFYITRDEAAKLTLISPKNQEMTVDKVPDWINWFAGKNFDVITMKEPDIGEWQVQGGVSTEGFATVLTNLKLITDWPIILRSEDKAVVQARLYEGEKPVALPEMSGVVQYAFQVMPTDRIAAPVVKDFLNDEGHNGDKIAGDGIFSKYCTLSEAGEYKLSIVARGPTFERTQQIPFRVRPRLVTFEVLAPEEEEGHEGHDVHAGAHDAAPPHQPSHEDVAHAKHPAKIIHGDQSFILRAELSKEALSLRDIKVEVEALSQDRKKTIVPLKRTAEHVLRYEASAETLPTDGTYSFKAVLRAESKKHQEVEAESSTVRFELKSTAKRVETPEPVATAVPLAEPKQEEPFPILSIVAITLANIVAVAIGILLTKKRKHHGVPSTRYNPPKQMLDAIANLDEKLHSTEIKIGDVVLEPTPEPTPEPAQDQLKSEGAPLEQTEEPSNAGGRPGASEGA